MINVKIAKKLDIEKVLFDDEIFSRICDDFCPKEKGFEIPTKGLIFLGGYINDEIASLFIVNGNCKMHFMVLKAFRKHARDLLKESFKKYPHRVWVQIPTLYQEVINFAKKCGFKEVERVQNSHLQNSKYYDEIKLISERYEFF